MYSPTLAVIMTVSLTLLGTGFFIKRNYCHLLRAAGWLVFGFYWFSQFPNWIIRGEIVNTLGTFLSLPVFTLIAYHEFLSYRWKEEYEPLRFIAGAAFFASAVYFIIESVPVLSAFIINSVAGQTLATVNLLFGSAYHVTGTDFGGNPLWFRMNDNEISVFFSNGTIPSRVSLILACTGIQAITVAVAFLASVRSDQRKRMKALLLIIPSIYLLNLLRNVIIIHGVDNSIFGESSFYIMHDIIGKIGISMTSLIVLMVAAFRIVPEFYDCMSGVFQLPWRRTPGYDYTKDFWSRNR